MKENIKIAGVSIFFFILFIIVTFPYPRLGPKGTDLIEDFMKTQLNLSLNCDVDGFDFNAPFGFEWDSLACYTRADELFIRLKDGAISYFPKKKLRGNLGRGQLELKTSSSRIEGSFKKIPLPELAPLLLGVANSMNPNIPKNLKLEGFLNGSIDLPLKDYDTSDGKLDLKFQELKLPQQSLLDLIGLQGLTFTKSSLSADLKKGKMKFTNIDFASDHVSGKMEGDMTLKEDIKKSSGSVFLKWKVTKSDAILSSPIGGALVNAPCPRPDVDGYCTRRITRFMDLFRSY
jgi:hypothetical protein